MRVPQEEVQALQALARRKASEYAAREDLVAVAITGSLARGWDQFDGGVWAGSDVDLWAFAYDEDAKEFHDGVVESDAGPLYWEIDVLPLPHLQIRLDEESWLSPPGLADDAVTLVEALWGCQIVKDESGALYRLQQAINSRVADWGWLRRRAGRYLSYGRGSLEGLYYAPPLEAIVLAREVATRYALAAYWMQAGTLLTSVMRVPERIAHAPEIHRLYRELYGLRGEETWAQFLEDFGQLPAEIREAVRPDLEQEVRPVAEQGYYDGALRYLRALLPAQFGTEAVQPVLGLGSNLEVRHRRVLRQVEALLTLCGA